MGKTIVKVVGKKRLKRIWAKADDAIHSSRPLSIMYSDVPKEVDCEVEVFEIHVFKKKDRQKALDWLNRDRKK